MSRDILPAGLGGLLYQVWKGGTDTANRVKIYCCYGILSITTEINVVGFFFPQAYSVSCISMAKKKPTEHTVSNVPHQVSPVKLQN